MFLSWRTPLKAKRFESHDAFFASFFSKKNDEINNASIKVRGNPIKLNKNQIKAIQKGSIIDWVNDTHKLTRQVYANVKPDENLRYRYSYDNFETVRNQLQKGGIRLAKVLNELF